MEAQDSQNLVADGCGRARKAVAPGVRAEVERAYAEQLRTAGWLARWLLRRRIDREVARRVAEVAPGDALYLCPAPFAAKTAGSRIAGE